MAGAPRALLFCGQGAHRKGMALDLIAKHGCRAAKVWDVTSDCMMQKYRVHVGTLIQDNAKTMRIHGTAMRDIGVERPLGLADVPRPPSAAGSEEDCISVHDKGGLMNVTAFAQVAMVSAQLAMLEDARENRPQTVDSVRCVAGHSLGEFTALSSIGIFPPDVVVDLVWRRGVLMQNALAVHESVSRKHEFLMYACNPKRAQLDSLVAPCAEGGAPLITASDIFSVMVEVVGQTLKNTTSFVELVNANVEGEQYVVAGDAVGLAVLGKVLDPQFRANAPAASPLTTIQQLVRVAVEAVKIDAADGITEAPNAPFKPDFVPGSAKRYGKAHTFKRTLQGPDDGKTRALDRLTHLTLEDDGRSGLKRKSWFVPLNVSTPFHSSLLRRMVDELYPLMRQALPSDAVIAASLQLCNDSGAAAASSDDQRPVWVTNLTGTGFGLGRPFRNDAKEFMSAMNVGEVTHHGKFSIPTAQGAMLDVLESSTSPRELMAVVLAAQAAHTVQWIASMETMFKVLGATSVSEIAPQPTLSEMVKRAGLLPKTT